jgi:hypothetical protein
MAVDPEEVEWNEAVGSGAFAVAPLIGKPGRRHEVKEPTIMQLKASVSHFRDELPVHEAFDRESGVAGLLLGFPDGGGRGVLPGINAAGGDLDAGAG